MTVFFTADHHFGHANVIAFQDRPWPAIADHDAGLIDCWNAVVGPTDVVYHLGDFAYRTSREHAQSVFNRLNGVKHFIRGNHDKSWVDSLVWASVNDIAQVSEEGTRIVLCHYAMRVWPGDRRGAVMLYGHSHGRLSGNSQSLDVGVDCWGFTPESWSQIRDRLATLPPRLPPEDDDALGQGV